MAGVYFSSPCGTMRMECGLNFLDGASSDDQPMRAENNGITWTI